MTMLSLAERAVRELGSEVNPLAINAILAMTDAYFLEWLSRSLEEIRVQILPEFSEHLKGAQDSRQSTCRLGTDILIGRLKLLAFVLEERYGRKFEAIDMAP